MSAPSESLSSRMQKIEPTNAKIEEMPEAFPKLAEKCAAGSKKGPAGKMKRNSVTSSGERPNTGPWSCEEHQKFLEAMNKYGNDWSKVCEVIGTRTPNQARSHAQKYYNKKMKQAIDQVLADKSGKRKLFAVTREYTNRTAIKSALELMDVPSRLPKKKKEESDKVRSGEDVPAESLSKKGKEKSIKITKINDNVIFFFAIRKVFCYGGDNKHVQK